MIGKKKLYALPLDCFKAFHSSLSEESDRSRVIVVACWIEEFLKVKLMNEFSKGNAEARKSLFSDNGPFGTFSTKINAAFCAGWIDSDVHHDIHVIRKLRNVFAHNYNPVSLDEEETRTLIQSLRVPHRQFYDWGQLRAASTHDSVVIFSGDNPPEAKEELHIPGAATFRIALPIVLAVLASNLAIPFATDEEGTIAKIELPKHMETGQQDVSADAPNLDDNPDYRKVLNNPERIARFINGRIDSKLFWYRQNREKYHGRTWETWQQRVLDVLYQDNLKIDVHRDGTVLCEEGNLLIIEWRCPCPVLDHCHRIGCSTKDVCSTLYHVQYQALLSLLVPGAFFARDYSQLRPNGDACIEVIIRRPDVEELRAQQ